MRIGLSKSQTEHLIKAGGIPRARLPSPRPDTPLPSTTSRQDNGRNVSTVRGGFTPQVSSVPLWIIVPFVILLIILLLASRGKAETNTDEFSIAPVSKQTADRVLDGFLPGPVAPTNLASPAPGNNQTCLLLTMLTSNVNHTASQIDTVERCCRDIVTLFTGEGRRFDRRMMRVESEITAVSGDTGKLPGTLALSENRMASALGGVAKAQQSVDHHMDLLRTMLAVLIGLSIVALVLLLYMIIRPMFSGVGRHNRVQVTPSVGTLRPPATSPPVTEDSPIPAAEVVLADLVSLAAGNADLSMKPSLVVPGWRMGVATTKGQVRLDNQDYGLAFGVGNWCVAVIGDGVGGAPDGASASYQAVRAACSHLMYYLGQNPPEPEIPDIVNQAMMSASHALTQEAINLGRHGLRTTLIVVVATPSHYYFSHIGDGGGVVVRQDGSVDEFLVPQKVPGTRNMLAASLGPTIQGMPRSGCVAVLSGDLLMAGSDGVFDHVDDCFIPDMVAAVNAFKGDVKRVAETAVKNLAEAQDDDGILCDDNMTLALLLRTDGTTGASNDCQ